MTKKSLWEDTTNGIMIPSNYKLPLGNANWLWLHWYLLSYVLEMKKEDRSEDEITDSLDDDPYQIWAVFNYTDEKLTQELRKIEF